MGIGFHAAKLLCMLKAEAIVNYDETLMLGRQNFNLSKHHLKKLHQHYSHVLLSDHIKGPYSESFFRALGSKKIESMDASEFEGATILHDLNKPIPSSLEEQYTCIVDGGTTEHVFNFPAAIKNIMKMLKVGGTYIGMIPSNQWNGHGFYQFSAMLYIQLFCASNNFELQKLCFFDGSNVWELLDRDVSKRIEIVSHRPLEIYVVAKKTGKTPEGDLVLQQGDYQEQWNGRVKLSRIKKFAQSLPWGMQWRLKQLYTLYMQRKQLKKLKL